MQFLLHRTNCDSSQPYISACSVLLDPYLRKFVRPSGHSNHRYFIDPRHVGDTIHLWTAFVWGFATPLRPLSAVFAELLTHQVSHIYASRSLRESVSGRYPFIPLFGLSVHKTIFQNSFHFQFISFVPNLFSIEHFPHAVLVLMLFTNRPILIRNNFKPTF